MKNFKIGTIEAICLIVIVTITHTLLSLPKTILGVSGSASFINIIFITILMIFITLFIVKLFKKFDTSDILDISKYLGGSIFQKIIGTIFILYLLFISAILLRSIAENLKLIYFQDMNISAICIVFIIAISLVNRLHFKNVIKCNMLITIFISISIIMIFILSISKFNLNRIYPILGNGTNSIFISGLGNIFAFGSVFYLYFLIPILKKPSSFKKISIISLILTSIFLLISIASLLFIFPQIVSEEGSMPIYLATREISLGRFINRADALFVLIWILAILSYLSVLIAHSLNIFKKITNIQDTKPLAFCFGEILLAACLIPENISQIKFAEDTIYKYSAIIIAFGVCILILILANIKKRRKSNV